MLSRRLAPLAGLSGLILLAGLTPAYAAPTKTPTPTKTATPAASATPTPGKPTATPSPEGPVRRPAADRAGPR
ncbi:hypothetical protein B0O41_1593 [Propionibacteriaceae bacterium ES.041]|nr:hypothetical protein B0O41_1593 [Propionibacteriaceae bacterium ES.041]